MTEVQKTLIDAPAYPFERETPFQLSSQYDQFEQHGPPAQVNFKGFAPAWLVSSFDDVRTILHSPNTSVTQIPDPSRGAEEGEAVPGFFVAMDPPEHTKLRRILAKEFTPRRIKKLRPTIERIADELIDDILSGPKPADLVSALALPLPSLVITELLGVPYDKHDWFQEQTRVVTNNDASPEEVGAAIGAVMQYLGELAGEKAQNPGDDLVSLLAAYIGKGELEPIDVAGLSTFLLMAGHETTGNMLSVSQYALLQHPDQYDLLRENPELWPQAVEELLRYLNIVGYLPRRLTESVEINGQVLEAGELVMAALGRGDRDPQKVDNPDILDITRESQGHLAFGHGIHTCMGAPLARLELQIVLGKLLERIPTMRLAVPEDQIQGKPGAKIYGLRELPITW